MLNAQTRYVDGAYEIVIVAKFQNMGIFYAFLSGIINVMYPYPCKYCIAAMRSCLT